jgi:hypothetical protein
LSPLDSFHIKMIGLSVFACYLSSPHFSFFFSLFLIFFLLNKIPTSRLAFLYLPVLLPSFSFFSFIDLSSKSFFSLYWLTLFFSFYFLFSSFLCFRQR